MSIHSEEPLATALNAARKKTGLSLQDISGKTRISVRHLQAIESCTFKGLPGGVYSTSYIRQYARAIGFDECELLACYRQLVGIAGDASGGAEQRPDSTRGFRFLSLFEN